LANTPSPTSAYNAQNGVVAKGTYDPVVVDWVRQAAAETGADPVALLATSLQESGAQRGRVGDAGTSYGPFQFHRGGALANHTPQWANTYEAVLNRAQEFKRLGVRGGTGAAAVQRPRDPHLYAKGVDSLLSRAAAILGDPSSTVKEKKAAVKTLTPQLEDDHVDGDAADVGDMILQHFIDANAKVAKLPGSGSQEAPAGGSLTDQMLQANAGLAGIQAPFRMPTPTPASVRPAGPGGAPPKGGPAAPGVTVAKPGKVGKVIVGPAKIIGGPAAHQARPIGNWQSDNAVDIALKVGTPIRAPADGVIGSRIGSLHSSSPLMQGLRVNLAIDGNDLYFAHLSRLAVKAGQRVKAGQIIGYSGVANGVAHLHLGSRVGNPGKYA